MVDRIASQMALLRSPIIAGIGFALTLAVGAVIVSHGLSTWLGASGHPPVSPVLCAILIGVVWRNTVGLNARWLPGVEWITHRLLRVGIALVGLRLTLHGIAAVGAMALPVVLACITTAVTISLLIGRWLGLSRPLRTLLAAGTAICGCTAIVAVAPVVRARSIETGLALTCVVVLGATGMLLYPWLGHALFAANTQAVGVFLGTSIHDTSQVVGAALIYAQQFASPDVMAIAGLTKLLRNLTLLVFIPLAAAWTRGDASDQPVAGASPRRSQFLPTFLLCFLALALVRNVGDRLIHGGTATELWNQTLAAALGASDLFLVCGMTAVGLTVVLRDLRQIGARALVTAVIVALAVACSSVAMTFATAKLAI